MNKYANDMSSTKITLDLFMRDHEEYASEANFARIYESITGRNAMMNDTNILATISREGIGYNVEFQNALQEFFAANPRWNNDTANTRSLIEAYKRGGFSYVSLSALESCALTAGLSESAAWKAKQAASNERATLIRTISGGKDSYQRFVPAVGTFRNFQTADLESMDTDQLRAVATEVEEHRRVRGLDAAQVRAEVHQTSQRYSQYLNLPPTMPDGRPWSIYNFNKQPMALIKDQIRKYGVENINAACQAAATHGAR